MGEEYVTICVACTKGVTKDSMQYVNGMVFHPECYQKHGNDFQVVDHEVAKNAARLKVDLVQLKNLKLRKKMPAKTKSKSKPKKAKKKTEKKTSKKRRKVKAKKGKRRSSTKKARKVTKKKSKKRVKSSKKRARKRR